MNNLFSLFCIASGGAIGSVFRHLLATAISRWWGLSYGIPTVNIIGGVMMGMLVTYFSYTLPHSYSLRLFLMVGLLGGFTTFSTFSLDVVTLYIQHKYLYAIGYLLFSVFGSIAGVIIGMSVVRFFYNSTYF